MAVVDFHERQLTLKLVYYGPPLSGKTTNLRWIHSQVDELSRGRLMTLDTRDDRTLFFDLLPIFFKASNLSFRVKVYTVPGQPLHDATRRVVLKGVDGIVFVADSSRSQVRANNESFQNLHANLSEMQIKRNRVPIVVQFNKRDLPDIVSEEEIEEFAANNQEPTFRACALDGRGVFETFFGLLEAAWQAIDAEIHLRRGFGLTADEFMAAVRRHCGADGGAGQPD